MDDEEFDDNEASESPCSDCGHAWEPHVLVATMVTMEHGGLIFCWVPGCMCENTWSIDDAPMPYIPDDARIEELRAYAQADGSETSVD